MMKLKCCSFALLFLLNAGLLAQKVQFPLDGVVNILDYNPNANDGITDASQAIQQAIDEHSGDLYRRTTLYFPSGTYIISRPVFVEAYGDQPNGGNGKGMIFQGEGKDFTKIQLSDNNPLFQNPGQPLPALSNAGGNTTEGWTAIGFMKSVFDLTIDIGRGNPGAIGLRFIANNQGTVKNVRIQSSDPNRIGWAGIDMERLSIPGPALIKNVEIIGFDHGIRIAGPNYGMTLEHVEIKEPRLGGIRNNRNILNIRGLVTENIDGPALENTHPDGMITLIDSRLQGSGEGTAFVNRGNCFIRNVEVQNYANSLDNFGELTSGYIDEFHFPSLIKLWEASPDTSLRLKIEETPQLSYDDPENWVNVTDFGYSPGSAENPNYADVGPAIRAAIAFMNEPGNESKTTLYFEPGDYRLASSIRIYGNIKRMVGNFAAIFPQPSIEKTTEPIFTIDDTRYETIIIERINFAPVCCNDRRRKNTLFLNNSSRDVVLQHVYIGHGKAYEKGTATGRLFLEDICALSQYYYIHTHREEVFQEAIPQFEFKDQLVWARQFNTEQRHTKASSLGGQLWVLGLKTEEPGVAVYAKDNARVEILGGTILPSFPVNDSVPFIKVENAEGSFVLAEHAGFNNFNRGGFYKRIIEENRGKDLRFINRGDTPQRLQGDNTAVSVIPLYVAHGGPRVQPSYLLYADDSLDFGEVTLGRSAQRSLHFRNEGNSTVEISEILYPDDFNGPTEPFSLTAGEQRDLLVSFSPSELTTYSDTITVLSNAENGPTKIQALGAATPSRIIQLSGVLVFPNTPVGQSSEKTLRIENKGVGTLTVNEILVPEGFRVDTQSFILAPQEFFELVVAFEPNEAVIYSGLLEIKSDATSGNNVLNIAGKGVGEPVNTQFIDISSALTLFPNPVTDSFSVMLENEINGTYDLSIIDTSGRLIFQIQKIKNSKKEKWVFDTRDWTKGQYFLEIKKESMKGVQSFMINGR